MLYLYPLGNGDMLCLSNDNIVVIEHTGEPYPECSISYGDYTFTGQHNVLRAILGYQICDYFDFVKKVLELKTMPFNTWRWTIQSENIGGGCPSNVSRYAKMMLSGASNLKVFIKMLIPNGYEKTDDIDLSDEYLESMKTFLSGNVKVRISEESIEYFNLPAVSKEFADWLIWFLREYSTLSIQSKVTIISHGNNSNAIRFSSTEDVLWFGEQVYGFGVDLSKVSCDNVGGNLYVFRYNKVNDCYATVQHYDVE